MNPNLSIPPPFSRMSTNLPQKGLGRKNSGETRPRETGEASDPDQEILVTE
jgi:hypothetical protein